MTKSRNLLGATALGVGLMFGFGAPQEAGAALVTANFGGTDCAGYFGTSFGACEVFIDENDEKISFSPVIAKYDVDEDSWEVNTDLYPSVTGTEFSGSFLSNDDSSGSWTYSPTGNDPGVRYWVAKGGQGGPEDTGFRLHWDVSEADLALCSTPTYNAACLDAAQVVTAGNFETAFGGLSHLTFYDTTAVVPVPAALPLLLTALGALGVIGRKKIMAA